MEVSEELMAEGYSMLSTVCLDFADLGLDVLTLIDHRLKGKFETLRNRNSSIQYEEISTSSDLRSLFKKNVINADNILIIAPEMENILANLTRDAEEICKSFPSKRILNPPSTFTMSFSDKIFSEVLLKKHKIPFPPSFSVEEFLNYYNSTDFDREQGKTPKIKQSFIVKPSDGVGCLNTFEITLDPDGIKVHHDTFIRMLGEFFERIRQTDPDREYLVQTKIEGVPCSVSFIIREKETVFFSINKQNIIRKYQDADSVKGIIETFKLDYKGGKTPFYGIDRNTSIYLRSVVELLARKYNVNGFLGIDFIYRHDAADSMNYEDRAVFLEVNPRITTPYIAYSEIFRNRNQNIASLFFTGRSDLSDIKVLSYLYEKNKNTNAVELNRTNDDDAN